MNRRSKKYYIILFILLLLIIYLFWGPLFPWSPIKPGYEHFASSKISLSIKERTAQDSVVLRMDQVIKDEETFHGLKFKSRVRIIVTGKNSNIRRFTPWIPGKGYSISLSALNLVYIGPTSRKSKFGIEPYIKHELSHMLIGQNTDGLDKKMEMLRQSWLVEGLAIYFGGPRFYSKDEVRAFFIMHGMEFSSLHEANIKEVPMDVQRLYYSYYGYFTEFLIRRYGLGKMQQYLKAYIEDPFTYEELFFEVYGSNKKGILLAFTDYMHKN